MTADDLAADHSSKLLHRNTVAVTAGRPARVPDAPLNTPLVPASTYVGGGELGYGRYGNPGWTALEDAIGALEGGRALTYGSGMAAAHVVLELLPVGGTLVIPRHCYLGVAAAAQERAERYGLEVRIVDLTDTDEVLQAADGADIVWLESPTNPMMEVADLTRIGRELRDHPAIFVVDNTFATPLLQTPIALGADIVLHSATKFLSGHSDAVLGALVVPESAGDLYDALEATRKLHGGTPGTLEAYLVLRGIRTLPLRIRQAEANATELATRLADHPSIDAVYYPGLEKDPGHALAKAQMSGFGSLLSIELRDAATADALVEAAELWVHATSLGGVESTFERRRRWAGELPTVPEGLIRMSVGVEDVEDLWDDLTQALDKVPGP